MKFTALLIFLCIGILLPYQAQSNTLECEPDWQQVIDQLVQKELPNQNFSIEIKAYNDLLCEPEEDMANVVAVLTRPYGTSLYGIFHIHVYHGTNNLASASSFDDDKMFKVIVYDLDWKKPWCTIIKSVYNEELEAQGCIKRKPPRLNILLYYVL